MRHPYQSGAAVIMVLLIVALATTLATYMAQQQSLWHRQVESQFERAQVRYLGTAAIDWARAILADDAASNNIDHGKELWALRLPAIPIENGEITGFIEDRQGLFNLNNLVRNGAVSPGDVAQFQRLLELLGLPGELAPALQDWLDADSEVSYPGGAEDGYYLSLPHPYRTANRPLLELGELAKVKGFDSKAIERLRPYVSALPPSTAINVNFASPEVLASVIQGLSLPDARLLAQQRQERPFKSLADFSQRLPNPNVQITNASLTVASQFFWVTGRATSGQAQIVTQALLQRGSGWPTVIWQSVQ